MPHKTIGEAIRFPKLNQYSGLEGNIPLRYGDVFMGIEVEAENVSQRDLTIPGSFHMVEDGSLKLSGREFVTVPIKLVYLEKELERLFGAIPDASFSSRTSIHVHMNARDFTVQNMLDFTMLYALFEKNLYEYSGNRWYNNFCIPLRTSPKFLIDLMAHIHNQTDDRDDYILSNNISWSKYLGYNLGPLTGNRDGSKGYGTIEFRHMKGNRDIPFIINWCNLITCMKFYIKSVDSDKFHHLINTNQGHTLVDEVFRRWSPLVVPKKDLSSIKDSNTFLKYCIEYSRRQVAPIRVNVAVPPPASDIEVLTWGSFLSVFSGTHEGSSHMEEISEAASRHATAMENLRRTFSTSALGIAPRSTDLEFDWITAGTQARPMATYDTTVPEEIEE